MTLKSLPILDFIPIKLMKVGKSHSHETKPILVTEVRQAVYNNISDLFINT